MSVLEKEPSLSQHKPSSTVWVWHIFVSDGHNFKGRHGQAPDTHPMKSVSAVECVAGRGLVGDRYFDHKRDYKGQITFFSWEVFEKLCRTIGAKEDASPADLRRNVLVEGINLNDLVGKKFEIAGVRFEGTEECAPCYWMDQAVAAGAEAFLRGQGGLRAKILNCGFLTTGEHKIKIVAD